METIQLEMQNQEMEQKLIQLRQSMSREKEERERTHGYHWKSGQTGNQTKNHKKENIGKASSEKVKLKVLKNQIPEPEKLKTSRPADMPTTEKSRLKGKVCGQCEIKSALLMCLECGEDYCAVCFAKIHQKGALKLHRTTPIQGKSQDGKLDASHAFRKELNVDESSGRLEKDKTITGRTVSAGITSFEWKGEASEEGFISEARDEYFTDTSGSLLHGSFNEEESAKYFNEALLEWRNQTNSKPLPLQTTEASTVSTDNSAVQTVLTLLRKPFQVEFKDSGLSYMEKLMLKKHRRTPVNPLPSKQLDEVIYSPTVSENEMDVCNDLTAEEMEAHEHYVALFRAEDHVRNDVMHEPALKIVELDKEPEGGLEETRHFLVTDVETSERFWEPANQKQALDSARLSSESPVCLALKHRDTPLLSTYCVDEQHVKSLQDNTYEKASHSQDSKSMKYKSFKDSQSLDAALMVNVPQEFHEVVLREKNQTSDYQGLKGFFTLETDHKEVKNDLHSPRISEHKFDVAEESMCTGNDYWRPESSLSNFADESVVEEIVLKAQEEYSNHILDRRASPRYVRKRMAGNLTGRPFSANSVHRMSDHLNHSRPSTARERPMSRAASEILEIEHIDSADRHDHLFENENERETVSVLEKELNALKSNDDIKVKLLGSDDEQLEPSRYERRVKHSKSSTPFKRSPVHTVERCAEESESDDEETLQDKLNVLSLQ
ncbi:zinc finger B-box domain-containing protein 1 isoform X2 [Pyxicephalus adspersus]|uniref:zinc finger B-box domain-containing protein 1 isoform X2 n=1 Tax=Pyxicephalus adspersus TaxID=30357 RepID=UPI003B5A72C7